MRTFKVSYFKPGSRIWWRNRSHDQAFVDAIVDVERNMGQKVYILQGSYNKGVAASAGTHDGGGCEDLSSIDLNWRREFAKRGAVFFPRTRAQGFAPHSHGFLFGASTAAWGLKAQMVDWALYGRNGLATRAADDSGVRGIFQTYPQWQTLKAADVRPDFYLDGANKAMKYGNTVRPYNSIKLMQTALNKIPGGTKIVVDGFYGPKTNREFNAWRGKRFKNKGKPVTYGPIGVRSAKLMFLEAKMKVNVRATDGGKVL